MLLSRRQRFEGHDAAYGRMELREFLAQRLARGYFAHQLVEVCEGQLNYISEPRQCGGLIVFGGREGLGATLATRRLLLSEARELADVIVRFRSEMAVLKRLRDRPPIHEVSRGRGAYALGPTRQTAARGDALRS